MEIEIRRVTKNAGVDQDIVSEYVDELLLRWLAAPWRSGSTCTTR
ncbi:MAG: hypothetical protein QM733_22300 [Ilumatobacteraceae bacterium]